MQPTPRLPRDRPCVGVLLWRRTPTGREVAVVELDGRAVLPKGVLEPDEDEAGAAARLAGALGGARVRDARRLAAPPSAGPPRLAWWSVRWDGVAGPAASNGAARVSWLPLAEAELALDHRVERGLIRAERQGWLRRWGERLGRARERAARAAVADLDELERRLRTRTDGPGGTGTPSWRARALDRLGRAREALADGDAAEARRALAEVRRVELHGMDEDERALTARELIQRAEVELSPAERLVARELLAGRPDASTLERAARLVDDARERRASGAEARRAQRTEVATLGAVILLAVWTFGSQAWFARESGAAPADLVLAVLLFGLLGGAASTLVTPDRARGAPIVRAVVGAAAALVLFAFVRAGFVDLPVASAPGWLALAFAAGFLERVLLRPHPPAGID